MRRLKIYILKFDLLRKNIEIQTNFKKNPNQY
jgi:hypothetical protein